MAPTLVPDSKGKRVDCIRLRRGRCGGKVSRTEDAGLWPHIPADWYRRLSTLYPEFMFQDMPAIEATVRMKAMAVAAMAALSGDSIPIAECIETERISFSLLPIDFSGIHIQRV